jgi:hypothetical protein
MNAKYEHTVKVLEECIEEFTWPIVGSGMPFIEGDDVASEKVVISIRALASRSVLKIHRQTE